LVIVRQPTHRLGSDLAGLLVYGVTGSRRQWEDKRIHSLASFHGRDERRPNFYIRQDEKKDSKEERRKLQSINHVFLE